MYVCRPVMYVVWQRIGGGGGWVETGRSARAKKKKKNCVRQQKIAVVLCKGDDSVRL